MASNGCVIHAPKSFFVAVREDYVGICRGMRHPHCAAALLNMFEMWSDVKYKEFDQELMKRQSALAQGKPYRVKVCMWIYASQSYMKETLLGLFGETLISRSIQDLENAGFIRSRTNPDNSWDKAKQYLFFPIRVQNAIYQWAHSTHAPSRISTASKRYKYGIEDVKTQHRNRRNRAAIPKTPSKTSSKRNDKEGAVDTAQLPNPQPDAFMQSFGEAPLLAAYLEAHKAAGKRAPAVRRGSMTHLELEGDLAAAGYTPEQVKALTLAKLKNRAGYPIHFLREDLPEWVNRQTATDDRSHAADDGAMVVIRTIPDMADLDEMLGIGGPYAKPTGSPRSG